jgi:transcriptional antiterminator NusG
MEWYILQVHSNFEHRVSELIRAQLDTKDMSSHVGDILIPEKDVITTKRSKFVKSKQKLYPGYVFVQADMSDDLNLILRHTPKVLGFVGGSKRDAVPMPKKEIDTILEKINISVDAPEYKVTYRVGEGVSILTGPFKDFKGIVEHVNYDKQKLRVSLLVFNRSTEVDIDFKDVEVEV